MGLGVPLGHLICFIYISPDVELALIFMFTPERMLKDIQNISSQKLTWSA